MCALINNCDKEIAWHFLCKKDIATHCINIEDIIVFPQTVTGATVTSDELEYAMWTAELTDDVFNQMHGHGHSHVNMGTSPSGVDTQYQLDMLNNGLKGFYLFAIWNKRGSYWHILYDVDENVVYEDEDIIVELPVNEWDQWALQEIYDKVTLPENTARPLATYPFFLDAPDDCPRDDDEDSEFDKYLDEMQHQAEMAEFYDRRWGP